MELLKVEIICPTRKAGNIVLDLKKKTAGKFTVEDEYVLKENTTNCIQLTFRVHNDIVHGLKFCVSLKKYGITSKDEEVVGSFAPTVTPHTI